jgi:hypothetical protein
MNLKHFLVILWIGFWSECTLAQQYAHVLEGIYGTAYQGIESDSAGNLYITGYFNRFLRLQRYFLEEKDGKYFCIKYDSIGRVQWAKQFNQPIKAIAVRHNHLYLTGQFLSTIQIDSLTLTAKGLYNTYLAQFSLAGELGWVRQLHAEQDALIADMTVDKQENIYLTGGFVGKMTFENQTLKPIKVKNTYLVKYDKNGDFQWVRQATGGDQPLTGIYVWGLTTDAQDHVIVSGSLVGAGLFGNQAVSSSFERFYGEGYAYNNDAFLAKYTPKGDLTWVRNVATHVEVQDIKTSGEGHIFLTGYFRGNLNPANKKDMGVAVFDKFTKLRTQETDGRLAECMFIAKYSSLGNLIWVKQAGSKGKSRGIRLEVDERKEQVLVNGFFNGELQFSDITLKTNGASANQFDLFVAGYLLNGTWLWATQNHGEATEDLHDTHLDQQGHLYWVGRFKKEISFDNRLLLSPDGFNSNGFLIQF